MPFNPFIGWTQTDLETELRKAQEELASGVQIHTSGAGDVSASGIAQRSAEVRISMLLVALNRLDPVKYPAADIFRPTRTIATMVPVQLPPQ